MEQATIKEQIDAIKEKLEHPETLGTKTAVFSRVTGYYRDVNNFNDGKTAEFKERKSYNIA